MVELFAEPMQEAIEQLTPHFAQLECIATRLRIFVDNTAVSEAVAVVSALLSQVDIKSIRAFAAELEDAFIALLRLGPLAQQDLKSSSVPRFDKPLANAEGVAIVAKELTRNFEQFCSVDHINFSVKQGEIFGLLGANGAGKTTAIKMLTGILPPSSGEGQVAGADMRNAAQTLKERIGYMSQAFSLYLDLTVMENLILYAKIYGITRAMLKPRIAWVLQITGLQAAIAQLAGSLPMGIRQRLALGCALVHQPSVLFLDEPTSGVDPIGRRHFWDILLHLARVEHVAILVTTHYMSEAEHCDHLALMYAGRIIADASPGQMINALQTEVGQLIDIVTDKPLAAMPLLQQAKFQGVALFGKHIHLLAKDSAAVETQIRSLLAPQAIQLLTLSVKAPTLEDVFVYRVLALENQVHA